MASKRIDELTTRTVVNTDLLPPTPSGGPSGSATVAAVVKAGLVQPNSGIAGAGASVTIKAADGVTSGAGGSIILQPGAQATTGGNGEIKVASSDGTKTISLLHDGTNGYVKSNNGPLYLRPSGGTGLRVEDGSVLSSDSSTIHSPRSFYLDKLLLFSHGVIRTSSNGRYAFGYSTAAQSPSDTGISRGKAQVINLDGGDNNPTYSSTLSSVPVSPAQITSDTNNYNPGTARFYRLNTDASRNITGLGISQIDGQECEIWNVGANNIVLKNEDANSTAANRFICTGAADITLAADEIVLLRYDATTARWRVRKI